MTPQVEEVLVVKARLGDTDAFAELVRTHHVSIRRYLTRFLRDATVADDLAQDVFVAALRDIKDYESRTRFIGWLYGIARHRAQMHLRSESRRSARSKQGYSALLDADVYDLDPRAHEQQLVALERCLKAIPAHAAELIRQHYFAATPLTEIARKSGKREGSVRVALLRARVWLRGCIDNRLSIGATSKPESQRA